MNAIDVQNVTKAYADFTLEPISLALPMGTIMGLVGENGAGKSTLVKLIMNAIPSDGGAVSIWGVSNQAKEFVDLKQDIGIVLDEAYFPEALSAKNINLIMQKTYLHWDTALYTDYLKQFKLPLDKQFKEYSRGMKMKLAIAVALSHAPKLLILDEATGGLDPMVRDEILDVFNDFTRDESHSILMSSHIVSDLEKICDYIAFLHNGKLVLCEEKDALLNQYALAKLSKADFEALPKSAIVRKKATAYGYDALLFKEQINPAFPTEKTTLEDIILFMTKENQ
ncbi:MAG: ABC transporter ATP-binding protein [Clostridia bacterium]